MHGKERIFLISANEKRTESWVPNLKFKSHSTAKKKEKTPIFIFLPCFRRSKKKEASTL